MSWPKSDTRWGGVGGGSNVVEMVNAERVQLKGHPIGSGQWGENRR